MITIHNFTINDEATEISVKVETGSGYTFQTVDFWTDSTYKDPAKAVDLSSKLSQLSEIEEFTITLDDVNTTLQTNQIEPLTSFDGIFFAEFTSDDPGDPGCNQCNDPIAVAANLRVYKLCLLNKVLELSVCDDLTFDNICANNEYCEILNVNMITQSLIIALELGLYDDAINHLNTLKILCDIDSTCSSCEDLSEYAGNGGLNFQTLNNELILV
jgi:hypothetical protein